MFDKLTTDFLNRCAIELKKQHNQELIEKEILEPILNKFSKKLSSYFTIFFIMYICLLVLIVLILITIYYNK
ncbi:hypothetical protein crov366 [Cafeteria roenbergensis virus]|uniref:Uncharacterized protein n=1 Tax=Cafeteria roenbergensis virus (strain BV-PW1) TaxID=693272 RepID=E3T5D7_CROVB|nr:hypothetical protein crov366 [Cafeteria roenbergensis virus BV-PW1]ADO67400.1 hypothetical protein crov366 [Cafeteria roenbergensis virus BV-PW1]